MKKKWGTVFLVGAGPGDPGLITVRGAGLLKQADVVVVDALVSPDLLKGLRARIIYAGKRGPGAPHGTPANMSQKSINQLLVRWARRVKRVVRLKGGDPFVFGRGSEELEALKAAGIAFEVVPGITSAIAAPAYAGIPVTDRRWASQVVFVTGHGQAKTRGADPVLPNIDWKKISPRATLVVLMGVASWKNIRAKLLASGFKPSLPVAAIESGTTPNQRVIRSTLKESVETFSQQALTSPAVIVVGNVARLGRRFAWGRPDQRLAGKRLVVTRARDQNAELISLLERSGAEVTACPAIRIKPIHPPLALKRRTYDGIIFLSAHAVQTFEVFKKNFEFLNRTPAICVGRQTRRLAQERGWFVTKLPNHYSSAGLLESLGKVHGKFFLMPRVQNAPRAFVEALRKKGAHVEEVVTYQTLPARAPVRIKKEILSGVDGVMFTSASTVSGFLKFFTSAQIRKIFHSALAVSMGPQTTAALRAGGVRRISEAKNATLEDLVVAAESELK